MTVEPVVAIATGKAEDAKLARVCRSFQKRLAHGATLIRVHPINDSSNARRLLEQQARKPRCRPDRNAGQWAGISIALRAGPAANGNHAKIGVSMSGTGSVASRPRNGDNGWSAAGLPLRLCRAKEPLYAYGR